MSAAAAETTTEENNDYRKALKDVIRKQLRELLQQLEANGEEVAVFAVDVGDFSGTQMGTTKGDAFMEYQTDLMPMFMDFCKNGPKDETETTKEIDVSPEVEVTNKRKRSKLSHKKPAGKANSAKQRTYAPEVLSDVLKVEIPAQFTKDITDNEVASLLGHLVAAQLVTNKLKGDSAGSTLKFKTLLELANRVSRKDKPSSERVESSPVKTETNTPSSTRSGRRVSSKFLESINSLKKQSRIKQEIPDDEPSEQESSIEEKTLIGELLTIDPLIIKRIHIKSGTGKLVDATFTELTSSQKIENLAKSLLLELDKLPQKHPIFNYKYVKVMIISDEKDSGSEDRDSVSTEKDHISVEIISCDWNQCTKKSVEEKDKEKPPELSVAEMHLDEMDKEEEAELGELTQDIAAIDGTNSTVKVNLTEHKAKKIKVGKVPSNISPAGLIRRPKGRHFTETMPVECPHCGVTLTGRSNLKSHIKRVHMRIKNSVCTICAKGFWSANALESHMLSVHTRQCESCQEYVVESVPWSEGLNMKTRRDVICSCGSIVSICSTFGRKRMYLHDNEPDEDGNIFVKRPKNNVGTKYACGTCGKLFMKKSNCERHSRKHSEIRKCVCEICGTGYIYESSLKKHMQSEHGVVKHVCDICGGNYGSLTALKVHIVKTHKKVKLDDANLNEEQLGESKEIDELDEEMEEEEEEERQTDGTPEIIINGSSGEIIVHHKGPGQEMYNQIISDQENNITTTESIVVTGAVEQGDQIILAKTDDIVAGEEHIVFDQGGHIVVTSEDTDQTAQLVQQVIGGQIIEQDGNMSIIIKQVPVENEMC